MKKHPVFRANLDQDSREGWGEENGVCRNGVVRLVLRKGNGVAAV